MGTFLRKPEKVKAVQWKGWSVDDLNNFTRELKLSEDFETYLTSKAEVKLKTKHPDGENPHAMIIPHGCYLIIDKFGGIEVMTQEAFELQFDVYFEDLEQHA